jgi:hypothetical protein
MLDLRTDRRSDDIGKVWRSVNSDHTERVETNNNDVLIKFRNACHNRPVNPE